MYIVLKILSLGVSMEGFGMFVALLLFLIAIVGSMVCINIAVTNYNLDKNTWRCTKTEIIGTSPNKHEVCLQYTNKKVN